MLLKHHSFCIQSSSLPLRKPWVLVSRAIQLIDQSSSLWRQRKLTSGRLPTLSGAMWKLWEVCANMTAFLSTLNCLLGICACTLLQIIATWSSLSAYLYLSLSHAQLYFILDLSLHLLYLSLWSFSLLCRRVVSRIQPLQPYIRPDWNRHTRHTTPQEPTRSINSEHHQGNRFRWEVQGPCEHAVWGSAALHGADTEDQWWSH